MKKLALIATSLILFSGSALADDGEIVVVGKPACNNCIYPDSSIPARNAQVDDSGGGNVIGRNGANKTPTKITFTKPVDDPTKVITIVEFNDGSIRTITTDIATKADVIKDYTPTQEP